MIFRTQLLSILLLVGACQANGDQQSLIGQALGWISQTRAVGFFEKHVQTKINNFAQQSMGYGDEPASDMYQAIGKEAQSGVGIPLEQHVPIKRLNPESAIVKLLKPGALAEPNAIFVNEARLKDQKYGVWRSALFHEAVHRKYRDSAMDTIIENGSMIAAGFAAHELIKACKPKGRFKLLHCLGVMISSFGASFLASKSYHHFMERRADTEGHYATQCGACVAESAERRSHIFEEENSHFKHNGYLWADDLFKIAHDLKDKQCAHHQNVA